MRVPEFFFLWRVIVVWVLCLVVFIGSGLVWPARKGSVETEVEIWTPQFLRLPREELAAHGGWKDFRIWWALFFATGVGLMVYFR